MEIDFRNLIKNIALNYNSIIELLNKSSTSNGFNIEIFNASLLEERVISLGIGITTLINMEGKFDERINSLPDVKLDTLKHLSDEIQGK